MIKSISDILYSGIRLIFKNHKFMYLLWGTNIIFSIVLTLPIFFLLDDQLVRSSLSKSLDYGFDIIWYLQFREIYKTHLGEFPYILIGVVAIYVLIQIFFLGGMVAVFNNSKKNHYVDFFYGGVQYWYRFTKVLLISLVFYALAFMINDLTGNLLTYIFANREKVIFEFILRASRYSLLIFLIGTTSLIGDYSKVWLAVRDSDDVWKAIVSAIRFLKENFYLTFMTFFLISLMGAAGAILYNIMNDLLPKSHYVYFIVTFILQQMLIIFRLFVRMFFTATEIILYKDLKAPIITTRAEEVEENY